MRKFNQKEISRDRDLKSTDMSPEETEILKKAFGEIIREEMDAYPPEEELRQQIQPSEEFKDRIEKALEEKEKKKTRRRIRRRISAVVGTVAAVFALVLLLNEDVRAFCLPFLRQQDNVMKMTDYKMMETEGKQDTKHGKIVGFELTYIPKGFVYKEELSLKSYSECVGADVYENKKGIILDFDYARNGSASINNEFADCSTITLEDGTVCDSYKSNTKGYASTLVWSKDDIICTLGIDYEEGWEYEELLKVANGIRTKYEDGTVE